MTSSPGTAYSPSAEYTIWRPSIGPSVQPHVVRDSRTAFLLGAPRGFVGQLVERRFTTLTGLDRAMDRALFGTVGRASVDVPACCCVIGEYELTPGSKVATICKRCKARNEVEMEDVEVKRVTVCDPRTELLDAKGASNAAHYAMAAKTASWGPVDA